MRNRCWVGVALVLGLALPVAAQVPGERGPGELGRPGGRGREEVFRMVDAYILSNMQEGLGLSDEAFVKLLPLVKRLQTERREAARKRMESLAELRRLLKEGAATEARVAESMKAIRQREVEAAQQQRTNVDAIDAMLDPVQQAKFRILELEVEQRLRRLLEQSRPPGPGGGPGSGPGGRRPGRQGGPEGQP